MSPSTIFHGHQLFHFWIRQHQSDLAQLVSRHGRAKFDRVYDWLFRYMEGLCYGQWFIVEKVCPNPSDRPLLYFILEMIYQGDLVSDFRVHRVGDETRIESVQPTPERKQSLSSFLGERGYLLNDWYGRIRANPAADPDLDPVWFGLSVADADSPPDRPDPETNET